MDISERGEVLMDRMSHYEDYVNRVLYIILHYWSYRHGLLILHHLLPLPLHHLHNLNAHCILSIHHFYSNLHDHPFPSSFYYLIFFISLFRKEIDMLFGLERFLHLPRQTFCNHHSYSTPSYSHIITYVFKYNNWRCYFISSQFEDMLKKHAIANPYQSHVCNLYTYIFILFNSFDYHREINQSIIGSKNVNLIIHHPLECFGERK